MTGQLHEIHAGRNSLQGFMKPMGLSARQLAAEIDISPSRVAPWQMASSPSLRMRQCGMVCFSAWARFWRSWKTGYYMRMAARTLTEKIAPRIRAFKHPVAA